MSTQDAFERILAAFYDAMFDEALWPATSALIDEACGMQGSALAIVTRPPVAGKLRFVGMYYRGERHAALEQAYRDLYQHIDESVPRYRTLPDSHVVHTTALYTTQELKTSPAYNEAMPRARSQDGLKVRLVEPDGSHIAWATADPVTRDGWSTPQVALFRGLLPHLRQFVRVRQALIRTSALHAAATDLLDTPRLGVIYLDRSAQIVAANDRARHLLRRGDGVSDRDGLLQASVLTERTRFAQLVAAALPPARPPVSGSMLLRRVSLAPGFVVHVTPVGGPQLDFGARQVVALVLLVEPGTPPRLDPEVVAAALGLTLVESHIAVRLAEGRTVREIAAALGRNPSAVYWHLKQSYQKLGIARQADLVRVVLSVAAFG